MSPAANVPRGIKRIDDSALFPNSVQDARRLFFHRFKGRSSSVSHPTQTARNWILHAPCRVNAITEGHPAGEGSNVRPPPPPRRASTPTAGAGGQHVAPSRPALPRGAAAIPPRRPGHVVPLSRTKWPGAARRRGANRPTRRRHFSTRKRAAWSGPFRRSIGSQRGPSSPPPGGARPGFQWRRPGRRASLSASSPSRRSRGA
jgi:hypothetical protein